MPCYRLPVILQGLAVIIVNNFVHIFRGDFPDGLRGREQLLQPPRFSKKKTFTRPLPVLPLTSKVL